MTGKDSAVKRVYTSVVAVFVLPPLVLLFLLEHAGHVAPTGSASLDRYLRALHLLLAFSSARHPEFWEWVVGVLALGFVSFAAGDWFTERWSRNVVTRIRNLLDHEGRGRGGAPAMSSGWDWSRFYVSTTGQFHGRDTTATLRISYAQRFNYNWLKISLGCRSPWRFQIKHKSVGARLVELFGESHPPTGDARLDQHLLFMGDDQAFYAWVCEPEVRRTILGLLVDHAASSIEATLDEVPVLRVVYAPFSFFQRNLIPNGTQQLLDGIAMLADSLESHAARGAASGTGTERVNPASERSAERSVGRGDADEGIAESWTSPTLPATSSLWRRLVTRRTGLALIVTGVLLLTGLPGTLVVGLGGQPSTPLTYSLAVLPWLGVGTLVAGVSVCRRSRQNNVRHQPSE